MDLIFIGIQGSGKGTQAKMLAEEYGYKIIGTGDLVREICAKDTLAGQKIKTLMDKGHLVPDETILELIEDTVRSSANEKIMFDGFPRTLSQLEAFIKIYDELEKDFAVVYIMLDEDTAFKRIMKRAQKQNRKDDQSEEKIRQRFTHFYADTAPIVDAIETICPVFRIDGEKAASEVKQDIELSLGLKSLEGISS